MCRNQTCFRMCILVLYIHVVLDVCLYLQMQVFLPIHMYMNIINIIIIIYMHLLAHLFTDCIHSF